MIFIEFGSVTRRLAEYMDDDDYRALQSFMQADPKAGDVIPGTGGVRKLRWPGSGRGKRGGLRIIYFIAVRYSAFLLLYLYGKGEQQDLTPDQKRALKKLIEPYQ